MTKFGFTIEDHFIDKDTHTLNEERSLNVGDLLAATLNAAMQDIRPKNGVQVTLTVEEL